MSSCLGHQGTQLSWDWTLSLAPHLDQGFWGRLGWSLDSLFWFHDHLENKKHKHFTVFKKQESEEGSRGPLPGGPPWRLEHMCPWRSADPALSSHWPEP